MVDTPDSAAATQWELERLKTWAEKHANKFSKGKCKILYLKKNNPRNQYIMRAKQMEKINK